MKRNLSNLTSPPPGSPRRSVGDSPGSLNHRSLVPNLNFPPLPGLPLSPGVSSPGSLSRSHTSLAGLLNTLDDTRSRSKSPARMTDDMMVCDDDAPPSPAAPSGDDNSPQSVLDSIGACPPDKAVPSPAPAVASAPPQNAALWNRLQSLTSNREGGVLPPVNFDNSRDRTNWKQHVPIDSSMMYDSQTRR